MGCMYGRICNALQHCVDHLPTNGCQEFPQGTCGRCNLGDFATTAPFIKGADGYTVIEPHYTSGPMIEVSPNRWLWKIDQPGAVDVPVGAMISAINGEPISPAWFAYHYSLRGLAIEAWPDVWSFTYLEPDGLEAKQFTLTVSA